MPNWCSNNLIVRGKDKDLQQMLKTVKGKQGVLDFNKIVPYPKEINEEMDKENEKWNAIYKNADPETQARMRLENQGKDWKSNAYTETGFGWCCREWGTKWNACSPNLNAIIEKPTAGDIHTHECSIAFDTAWSPPIPIVERLSKMFPDLTFDLEFKEEGMGFQGKFIARNGEVLTAFSEDVVYDEIIEEESIDFL